MPLQVQMLEGMVLEDHLVEDLYREMHLLAYLEEDWQALHQVLHLLAFGIFTHTIILFLLSHQSLRCPSS